LFGEHSFCSFAIGLAKKALRMPAKGTTRRVKEDFNQHRLYRVLQLVKLLKLQPYRTVEDIARFLETSPRSVYRYLNLLDSVGYSIGKTAYGGMFIEGEELRESFTRGEAELVAAALESVFPGREESGSVLRKLKLYSEVGAAAEDLARAGRAAVLASLARAMAERKQVLLKSYHSAHSGRVSDRVVEPVELHGQAVFLAAYDIAASENKYFRIDRIADVEVLDAPMRYSSRHTAPPPDLFGFALHTPPPVLGRKPTRAAARSVPPTIHLDLSMRAMLFLRSEYPLSAAYITPGLEPERYAVKAPVADYRPAVRFIQGFDDGHVKVLGDSALIAALGR
jgi:hypothetical protein